MWGRKKNKHNQRNIERVIRQKGSETKIILKKLKSKDRDKNGKRGRQEKKGIEKIDRNTQGRRKPERREARIENSIQKGK